MGATGLHIWASGLRDFCLATLACAVGFLSWHERLRLRAEFWALVRPARPGLFWQTVLILLPVEVLTAVGLNFLRQDRLLAHQDAQALGQSLAKRLAGTLSDDLFRERFMGYYNAKFEWQECHAANLRLSTWQGGAPAKAKAWERIRSWQGDHPALDLSAQPTVQGYLCLTDLTASRPQLYPVPPLPPAWWTNLSVAQRQLWADEEQAENTRGQGNAATARLEQIARERLAGGALAYFKLKRLQLETRGQPPLIRYALAAHSPWARSDELTPSGLPIGQLVGWEAVQWVPAIPDWFNIDGGTNRLPVGLVQTIAWAIEYRASRFTPRPPSRLPPPPWPIGCACTVPWINYRIGSTSRSAGTPPIITRRCWPKAPMIGTSSRPWNCWAWNSRSSPPRRAMVR